MEQREHDRLLQDRFDRFILKEKHNFHTSILDFNLLNHAVLHCSTIKRRKRLLNNDRLL